MKIVHLHCISLGILLLIGVLPMFPFSLNSLSTLNITRTINHKSNDNRYDKLKQKRIEPIGNNTTNSNFEKTKYQPYSFDNDEITSKTTRVTQLYASITPYKNLKRTNDPKSQHLSNEVLINLVTQKERSIALLLKKQKELTHILNKNTSIYIIIILSIVIGFGVFILYLNRKNKYHRLSFEKLIKERSNASSTEDVFDQKMTIPTPTTTINVPEKHIIYIMNKLEEFENEEQYLTSGISAQSLADEIKTNVKYLSRVINHSKNKSFTSYINELRITYAVQKLKENSKIRKYTIKAIANEMGYGNAETFSNAFYRQVGIKPSCFIRSIRDQ